jgi:hypothetical protein
MPKGGPPFIDRTVFDALLDSIPNSEGEEYKKEGTIYRDMSRLVVAILASADAAELRRLYNELGWGGSANIRPIQACAKAWMKKHYPDRALPPIRMSLK